jgi:Transposase and inactivated derivatives
LRRAQALLWVDDGESVEEVGERLGVTRRTIYNWINRLETRDGKISILDRTRSGRPCMAKGIIDPLIDEVIACDPRDFGYYSTVWTAPLLKLYLSEFHQIQVLRQSVSLAINWGGGEAPTLDTSDFGE